VDVGRCGRTSGAADGELELTVESEVEADGDIHLLAKEIGGSRLGTDDSVASGSARNNYAIEHVRACDLSVLFRAPFFCVEIIRSTHTVHSLTRSMVHSGATCPPKYTTRQRSQLLPGLFSTRLLIDLKTLPD
jgi:hypothetical protein